MKLIIKITASLLTLTSPLTVIPPTLATPLPKDSETPISTSQTEEALLHQQQYLQLLPELKALQQTPFSDLTPEQRVRLNELHSLRQELRQSFNEFIDHPEIRDATAQLGQSGPVSILALEDLSSLQDNLANLQQSTVLLYPLILEDRLELILVTPDTPPLRRTVAVNAVDLNQTISKFRQVLQSPNQDPFPPAQQLYQWLIAPFENELAQLNTEAIIFSPDRTLRYIPLAALYDGDQWLVERFTLNTITSAASLNNFDNVPTANPRLLLAGFTEGIADVNLSDKTIQLAGLPGVAQEIQAISALVPTADILLNEDFSAADLELRLSAYNIIHLATHALFLPDSPQDSFILMGNGETVTLRDLHSWDLRNVDLMVLSSSETALGGILGDGTEVLGMGYTMERAGVKAVLASLWNVSDQSTPILMAGFYQGLATGQSYAAALRQAQIAMITTPPTAESRQLPKGSISVTDSVETNAYRNFFHPYHWASFILLGGGL